MKNRPTPERGFARSTCAIANTLDIVGDKWSLLVIRDLLHGKQTYGELLDSPEGIPTNLLADRLKRLEEAGIVTRSVYQERPVRYAYALTPKGADLGQVLLALVRWGRKHIPGTQTLTPAGASGMTRRVGRTSRAKASSARARSRG